MTTYYFEGPAIEDIRPIFSFPPSMLVQTLWYGETVWRDAGGDWHQQFWPTPEQLDGAQVIYQGGRRYTLTSQQRTDLLAGGYGAYIIQDPPQSVATVGDAVVGTALVA